MTQKIFLQRGLENIHDPFSKFIRAQTTSSVFLLAFIVGLAIVDDVGAVLVIAIFYTQEISAMYLTGAFALIAFLAVANCAGIRQPLFYIIVGVGTWLAMLKSGIHLTVAGVAIALTVPARPKLASGKLLDNAKSILSSMQKKTKAAKKYLQAIHQANALTMEGESWGFPEFVHGQKLTPGVTRRLGWSAAAAIIGQHALGGQPISRINNNEK